MRKLIGRNRHLFNKIQSYFIIIVVMIIVYTVVTSFIYIDMLRQEAIDGYTSELENVSTFIDTSIHEVKQNISIIEYTEDLTALLYSNKELAKEEYLAVQKGYNFVNRLRATKKIISNVYILHKPNDLIIASDGSSSIEEYYKYNGKYEKYDAEFFVNLEHQTQDAEIFEPTSVYRQNRQQYVIPMAIYSIGGRTLQNYIFIDFYKDDITNLLTEYKATKNSTMFIYDNKYDCIIEHNGTVESNFDHEEIEEIISSQGEVFNYNHNGKRYMVIKNTGSVNFSQYEYVALVPVMDFLVISLKQITLPSVIILVLLSIIAIISYVFSKRVSGPIQRLVKVLRENDQSGEIAPNNDIEYINYEINKIITDNKNLTDDITYAMPYVYERYLISLLNNNTILTKDEIGRIVNRHDFSFEYNYFCVILTSIHFSEEFYENYSNEDYRRICDNVLLALKTVFPKEYVNYVLSIGKSQICTILNLNEQNCVDEIAAFASRFYDSFELEERYITLESGIGSVNEGLAGLHRAYQEATKALAINTTASKNQKVKTYKEASALYSFDYSMDEENKLLSWLLKGDKKESKKIFDSIFEKNFDNNLPESAQKEFCMYMYNTGMRVINLLNITPYDLMGDKYVNVISDVNEISVAEFQEYLELFMTEIVEYSRKTRSYRIDADELKAYLGKNYNKDMYLDKIADDFNISSSNISKMIKNALGMSFQKYISRIRIDNAKVMLKNTNKNVDSIARETGYNSRHTFIRMFKQLEGITPSDYRRINS